ncbi:MAG TPA: ester cyclase [Thermoanaerobaculia bacterium]|nr:ester cyclase [Thermoanaerobaculia bacterium]
MSLEENKAIARRFREDLWNTGDLALVDAIMARDCEVHARVPFTTDFMRGPEAMGQLVLFYRIAFSDLRMAIDQIVAEGDLVVTRWSGRGRHTGDLLGLPPTGRETFTSGMDMLRIEDGKIVEGWVSWDVLALIEQLAVAPGQAPSVGEAGFLSLLESLWKMRGAA